MMIWKTFLARFLAAPTLDLKTQHGSGVRSEVQKDPAVAIMSRLGLARVTIIATICSALLSMLVAWVLGFFIPVPNYNVHILLAFLIPFFVTPVFSYFTALSMRELKRARARSRQLADDADREREHLQAAVNNMPIGLVMFGADKRLIVGNDPYREMYGLPAEVMRRGTHLRDMLAQRLSAGSFEGAGDSDYIERILKLVEQTESTARRVELGDGRIFNILHHPIPGGGWIGTHEDATDREKLNARLANQNELLNCAGFSASYGLRGAGLSFHDIASRCFNVYCTRALCASMSKQLGQSVRHLLRVTVVHAASGSIAKLTPVGRPHLPQ